MIVVAWILATLAIVILLISALGILRLPDALTRQHAAAKAAPLGVGVFALALIVMAVASGWGWGWTVRLLVIVMVLLITLPLASHALARSGFAEQERQQRDVNAR